MSTGGCLGGRAGSGWRGGRLGGCAAGCCRAGRDCNDWAGAGRWPDRPRGAEVLSGRPLARCRAGQLSRGRRSVRRCAATGADQGGGLLHLSVPGPVARPARLAHPEVVVHQLVIAPNHLGRVHGLCATDPLRTLADLSLRADRSSAVSVLDSALNRRLVTDQDLLCVPRPHSRAARGGRGSGLPGRGGRAGAVAARDPCPAPLRRRKRAARRPPAGGPRRRRLSARHRRPWLAGSPDHRRGRRSRPLTVYPRLSSPTDAART